jgi:hypothetical protein
MSALFAATHPDRVTALMRSSSLAPPLQLLLALALVFAGQGCPAALQQLVATGVVEGLGDLMLAADVFDGPIAA